MKKQIINGVFGHDIYLLGKDENGIKYWLESPSFDCKWYWGFGYVETYTNNNNPKKSVDIDSHSHIGGYSTHDKNEDYSFLADTVLTETTYNETEKQQLIALFKAFYAARKLANSYHQNDPELWYLHNSETIPNIITSIIEILTPGTEKAIECKLPDNIKKPE